MWYVYILKCSDNSLYTGATIDIPQRLKRHNAKKASAYTRVRTPVTLVYQEPCSGRSKALKRECQIKNWTRKKKLALISGNKDELIEASKSKD